jgi:hypothetical protein
VLNENILTCTEDSCACDLSFVAQVCAQCDPSPFAVQTYNDYLDICKAEGYADPEGSVDATLVAQGQTDSAGISPPSGVPSGLIYATVTGSQTVSQVTSYDGPSLGNANLLASSTIGSPSDYTLLISSTVSSSSSRSPSSSVSNPYAASNPDGAGLLGTDDYVGPDEGSGAGGSPSRTSFRSSSTSASLIASTDVPSGSSTSGAGTSPASAVAATGAAELMSTGQTKTDALVASGLFFAADISSTCTADCADWKSLVNVSRVQPCILPAQGHMRHKKHATGVSG